MAKRNGLRVLVGTDGSDHAREAIATTLLFPWPGEHEDPGRRRAGHASGLPALDAVGGAGSKRRGRR